MASLITTAAIKCRYETVAVYPEESENDSKSNFPTNSFFLKSLVFPAVQKLAVTDSLSVPMPIQKILSRLLLHSNF